jgi:hypothetical protein
MTPDEQNLDMLVAELDRENRLLRSRNERLEKKRFFGLTDKEFEDIIMSAPNATVPVILWQLIQDKLREKNQ